MMHAEDASFVSFRRCDIYENKSLTEQEKLIEGFLRFLEIANKMRRPGQNRKPKVSLQDIIFTQVWVCDGVIN